MKWLEPKEIFIPDSAPKEEIGIDNSDIYDDGSSPGKTYIISRFDCVSGREIIAKYPLSAVPNLGDYASNSEVMFKLMSFVRVKAKSGDGKDIEIRLDNPELVKNHVRTWEALAQLEMAMLEYNCSFLAAGQIFSSVRTVVQSARQLGSLISTVLSEGSLLADLLLSKSSEQSTQSKMH